MKKKTSSLTTLKEVNEILKRVSADQLESDDRLDNLETITLDNIDRLKLLESNQRNNAKNLNDRLTRIEEERQSDIQARTFVDNRTLKLEKEIDELRRKINVLHIKAVEKKRDTWDNVLKGIELGLKIVFVTFAVATCVKIIFEL